MDGVHDLGGTMGFGPVEVEADEPVFHERWEGRAFALASGSMVAGRFGTPAFRHAMERMDPVHYLDSSYYEHWLTATATLLVETGAISLDDLRAGAGGPFPLGRPVHAAPVTFDGPARSRFALDDTARVADRHPTGHTRCPDYVRGHVGRIVGVHEASNVPELEAHGGTKLAEVSYAVRFACRELWGTDDGGADSVTVDLYDRYLEPA